MSNIPNDLKYTKEHEWLKLNGTEAVIGITDHAQAELGDIVFVELPAAGSEVKQGKDFGVVESVKTVSNLYSPVSGKIKAVNDKLATNPETVNKDPYGAGWIIKLEIADQNELKSLLDPEKYKAAIG